MEQKQRLLIHPVLGRRNLRLEVSTWQAVDMLAGDRGQSWQEWVNDLIALSDNGDNLPAAIRAAVIDGLLGATLGSERAGALDRMAAHPLMEHCAALDDAQLRAILKTATVAGTVPFAAYSILYGRDEYDQPCAWVRSNLRGDMHFAFVIPEGGRS